MEILSDAQVCNFVFALVVSNDYSFVCKRHNVSILAEELGLKKTEMFKILSFKDSTDPNFTEIGKK